MSRARVLGDNIKLLLMENEITRETFAESLGYSVQEVDRLCDAHLATTNEDECDIAAFFGVEKSALFTEREPEAYNGECFLHCMKPFKHKENKDKILNIFDMYCDLLESIPCE